MAHTIAWARRHWVMATASVLGHVAALLIGFVMMVVGMGLAVTVIMLPVGLVVGLLGVAVFVEGVCGNFHVER